MKIATIFLFLGVLCGAIYGITQLIAFIFKKTTIAQIVSDLLFSLTTGFMFCSAINNYFYGQIRLYIVIIFILGLYLERKTFGKLFAKLYFILYNVGRKIVRKFFSSKFGKIFFK